MRSIANLTANSVAQALVALWPTLLLSALMYRVVERPCLRAMAGLRAGSTASRDRAGAP
jgi:peptidoglycan/LPS O-acetylase OafA/YrhL